MTAWVRGTGSSLPSREVRNCDFATILETSEEWITTRTGIRSRRYAESHQSSATLSIEAARQALAAAEITAADIDLIVCGTVTPARVTPPNATVVQAALGCRSAPAFDLSAACSGFLYALVTAERFIRGGGVHHALVIGAEVLSRFLNFEDRTSCILFGDGAGAVVLSAGASDGRGILYAEAGADGTLGDLIQVPRLSSGGNGLSTPAQDCGQFISINGRETYRFAVRAMTRCLQEAVAACGLTFEDVSLVVPHQVNLRVFESVAGELGLPLSKLVVNIERVGNTAAASIPVALDEAVRSGRIAQGDLIVLVAFGGGLTWSTAIMRW